MPKNQIKQLSNNDIKAATDIILVNKIQNKWDIKILNKQLKDKTLVVIIDLNVRLEKSSMFKELLKKNQIRKFTWSIFPLETRMLSHEICFDIIDNLYEKITTKHLQPYNSLQKLFDSSDVNYVIKKEFLKRLNNQISYLIYIRELEKNNVKVTYYPPYDYFKVLNLLIKHKFDFVVNEYFNIKVAHKKPGLNQFTLYYLKKIKYLIVLLTIPFYALLKIRNISIKQKKKPVQLGLLIYNNDWGLHRGNMSMKVDWLLNYQKLDKDEIVFISENLLDENYKVAIRNLPLDYYDISYQNGFTKVSVKFIIKDLLPLMLFKNPILMIKSISIDTSYVILMCEALITYLLWKSLLYKIVPRTTLCYQGTDNKHFFRNIMLSKVGTHNWYYNHSNSSYGIYVDNNITTGRHINWSYLNYDYELHWSMSIKKHFRNNNGKSKHYYSIGPIWSYFIKRNMEFHSKYIENIPETNKIVSIFMTSIGPDAINSYAVHENFLCSIENMLNEKKYSDMTFLFKLKNKLDYIKSTSSEKFFHQLNKILDHKRIVFINENVFSGYVIFESDLVITEAFASPGIEALYFGKRSLYYDPLKQYLNSYLTTFPNLVAHGHKQLYNLIDSWLMKSQDEVEDYVDKYIKVDYVNEFTSDPIISLKKELIQN